MTTTKSTRDSDKITLGAGLFFATIVGCWAAYSYSDLNPLWVLAGALALVGVLIAASAIRSSEEVSQKITGDTDPAKPGETQPGDSDIVS